MIRISVLLVSFFFCETEREMGILKTYDVQMEQRNRECCLVSHIDNRPGLSPSVTIFRLSEPALEILILFPCQLLLHM